MLEKMENPSWLEPYGESFLDEVTSILGYNQDEWKVVYNVEIKGNSQVSHLFETALQSRSDGRVVPILYLSATDEDNSKKIMLHRVKTTDTMMPGGLVVTNYEMNSKEQALCKICNMRIFRIRGQVFGGNRNVVGNPTHEFGVESQLNGREILESRKRGRVQRRNRDRTKIVMDILSNVQYMRGASITQLIYKCNLNYKSAKSILSDLISRELLKVVLYDEQVRKYELTERGRTALERLRVTETL